MQEQDREQYAPRLQRREPREQVEPGGDPEYKRAEQQIGSEDVHVLIVAALPRTVACAPFCGAYAIDAVSDAGTPQPHPRRRCSEQASAPSSCEFPEAHRSDR